MGKYCPNCGNQLNENADVCLSCGHLINNRNQEGKGVATVSVVFGSLGFYPLVFIGSIVGLITSIVCIAKPESQYKGRAKIGLGLSIGSLCFWILYLLIFYFLYRLN